MLFLSRSKCFIRVGVGVCDVNLNLLGLLYVIDSMREVVTDFFGPPQGPFFLPPATDSPPQCRCTQEIILNCFSVLTVFLLHPCKEYFLSSNVAEFALWHYVLSRAWIDWPNDYRNYWQLRDRSSTLKQTLYSFFSCYFYNLPCHLRVSFDEELVVTTLSRPFLLTHDSSSHEEDED